MNDTIRNNIIAPYSLHDMNVVAFDTSGNDITMRTQSGIIRVGTPNAQIDGHVEFYDVAWDFSYVYLLNFAGNTGSFTGEKMLLKEFIDRFPVFGFSIMDETYGYNMTKYSGYLIAQGHHYECVVEIYHEGDMVFVDDMHYEGMKEVILSADNHVKLYSVPAVVAENLGKYCWDFAAAWVWHGPESGKYLKLHENQYVAHFNEGHFIEYLNRWLFPNQLSALVKELGSYEIPEEYQNYPHYNF